MDIHPYEHDIHLSMGRTKPDHDFFTYCCHACNRYGLNVLVEKNWIPVSLFEWTGIMAGLLFLGTGFMVLFQMVLALSHTHLVSEIVITIIFALLSILLGIAVIRIILKNRKKVDIRKRVSLVILGIIALFVWSGFLAGPVLAVLASLMPDRKQEPLGE